MLHYAAINPVSRNLDNLRPLPPSSPPVLGAASTTDNIIIEWGAAPNLQFFPTLPLFYRVSYALERPNGVVITGSEFVSLLHSLLKSQLILCLQVPTTLLSLPNQVANTVVTANVTTFSLWTQGDSVISGTFTSLPDSE